MVQSVSNDIYGKLDKKAEIVYSEHILIRKDFRYVIP